MPKDVIFLTLFNIKNTQRFFAVVNSCVAPVTLCLPNGHTKDLRFNFLAQNFLSWIDLSGDIPEVKLQCNNSQDVNHLIKFMIESNIPKTNWFNSFIYTPEK